MKKILVVLLILAVAGGVFAQQGDWSIGGGVVIGTRVDFDPRPDVDTDDPALTDGIGYFDWDSINGALAIGYSRGNVNVGLGFATKDETYIDVAFTSDTFKGQFKVDGLWALITNQAYTDHDRLPSWAPAGQRGSVNRLWGEFKFFDGVVTLVPAFASPETEYWISDMTGTFEGGMDYINGWKSTEAAFGTFHSFTYVDHNAYLLADIGLGGLSFGVFIPGLFTPTNGAWAGWNQVTGESGRSAEFIDDSIRQTIIGVKFEQSPFEFAAQFFFEYYGIYFGGKFFAGPITVGLSFMGLLDGDGSPKGTVPNDADPTHVKIGGRVDYEGAGFGAGLKGFYDTAKPNSGVDYTETQIGVEPFFFYDAIPSHLRFKLDAGMYFLSYKVGSDTEKLTVWALQPQLFWNFLGTGATDSWWGGLDTGIIIRYRIANADARDFNGEIGSVNFADVIFKWSF